MSPLFNIKKAAICLNPTQGCAYEIVRHAEKLPVWARRCAVPVTALIEITKADQRARTVLAFNQGSQS